MKNLTIIIPIHEITDITKPLFDNAYKNACDVNPDGKIMVVGPKAVLKGLTLNKGTKKVENEVSDLPHQINAAVDKVETDFFSVLEIDDTYSPIWFKNVELYMEEQPGNAVYLPIAEAYDVQNERVVGYINEITWASSFSQEMGYFDLDSLMNFSNICVSGAVLDTKTFKSLGSLKASMKLFYWYEYLLRAVNKGRKVYTVPKVGYHHVFNREGSLSDNNAKNITADEAEWWYTLAQTEYQFKNDKNKTYEA